jgi:xanthine dehydrogenase iron-sulfur cluster and FAD-binding subunit A
MSEVSPIDDIRSTRRYRQVVTGNLVAQFLTELAERAARPPSAGR